VKAKYSLKPDGFYIENFNAAKPFSSFLPGIAGELGKPMWVFYTNRGQCLASFGIRNKNGAMLEFYPANKAYTQTPLLGFRTFVRIGKGANTQMYEPFQVSPSAKITQRLRIRPEELEIEETNLTLGLRTRVAYFTLPGESLPGLIRQVTFENIGRRPLQAEVLDGLPQIVPYGLNEFLLKQMSRTMEAFAEVRHVGDHLPFFKLKIEPSDKPDVEWINGGFFAFALRDGKSLPIRTDPETVFGSDTSFQTPLEFAEKGLAKVAARTQSITASAFAETRLSLKAGQSTTIESFYGQAEPWDAAKAFRARVMRQRDFVASKRTENSRLIVQLTDGLAVHAGPVELDPYTRQTFLDNTLRGGQPVVLGTREAPKIFHMFTRKHGDMERDYNAFEVAPTYYSQGNGNFRDVNQNRRSENYLFGHVGAANIETFFNLIQIDGNNPLVIQGEKFYVPKERLPALTAEWPEGRTPAWEAFLSKPFNPGQLLEELTAVWGSAAKAQPWLEKILALSEKIQDAVHGEGYWVDHWIYNLDLLESFAAIHPDGVSALLFERRDFTYFDNDHMVQPRSKKYLRRPDGVIRQLHAVVKDTEKARLIAARTTEPHAMRTQSGTGPVYRTTLAAKILNLLAVKVSTLDPFGAGLEMESEKPGWCDAMNGLPGLLGSSTHEAFSLRRWISFLRTYLESNLTHGVVLPAEVSTFIGQITETLSRRRVDQFFPTWDRLASLREAFRDQVRLGIIGGETTLPRADILNFLQQSADALDAGAKQALKPGALCISYFINEVTEYEELPLEMAKPGALANERPVVHVKAKAFRQVPVSPFLEASVQALRAATPDEAANVYRTVRKSSLYDAKLGMYRLNVPLTKESFEIGRSKIFAPGWLENESIFLHMHYKFLLETLRSGLAKEFFTDIKRALVAFQDPAVYGRSPMENSSFIASSRFPDAAVHGTGFVARLSGATAEWISMVFYMGLGGAPFQSAGYDLRFEPKPVLPAWFFTSKATADFEKDTFGFKLFGKTWVVYKNPRRKPTFGSGAVSPSAFDVEYVDGRIAHFDGPSLPDTAAHDLRDLKIARLFITLS
jgi:hypothetical protein